MTSPAASVCGVGATLGEGPVWIAADKALWFVDIKERQVHRFSPEQGTLRSWPAPAQVGWILPSAGGLLAGLQRGIYRFDPGDGSFDRVVEVETDRPSNRLNDAATDRQGRIWFGSMDDTEREVTGRFYAFDRGRVLETNLPPVAITNGPAISPDGRTLYHVDTARGLVGRCEIHEDGSLGPSQTFVRITRDEGFPDGPTVDSEGHVWIALFFGWQARRYSPEGDLVETVTFPVGNITKLAFGGEDLRTAFVTTARHLLRPEELARQPLAGNVFSFRAEVPGLPVTLARLS